MDYFIKLKQIKSFEITQCSHDKNCCVWCMKGNDIKHIDRDKELILLSTIPSWNRFKLHTVNVEDKELRDRLNTLIASIPDAQTAFGIENRYDHYCWRKYVSNARPLTDENMLHLQQVNLREAQALFLHHVRHVIFQEHELRTLQSLLNDYKCIISDYGHNSTVKSSFLKELLINEFGEGIGFHQRNQKNVSELVYDTTASGTYIGAAINSLGVSSDQLAINFASRLIEKLLDTKVVSWPPFIYELEKKEQLCELLLKLITWM